MRRYRVVHRTGFKYQNAAVASYNEARMLPARDDFQIVFASKLDIKPGGASYEYADYFETRVVAFEALEPHLELSIVSDSLVELRPRPEPRLDFDWDVLAAEVPRRIDLNEYVSQSRRTQPPAELVKLAAKAAKAQRPHLAALEICKAIYQQIKYQSGTTGVHSIAAEAWKQRAGVCQDFAHLAVGALRSIGIPARYVSGYLHPHAEPKLHDRVMGESHAWVEWFAGDWFAYDPTNDVAVADRHINVARGRDYDDVPPLRGVFAGAIASELQVHVEITREL